jgi:curved DNA-binding protein
MGRSTAEMSLTEARALLGVAATATAAEIRRAYLDAAKTVHPDAGGAAEQFLRVVAAYRRLEQAAPANEVPPDTRPLRPEAGTLEITPVMAWSGGSVERRTADGRLTHVKLPVGLRQGDEVRAGDAMLSVVIVAQDGMQVRGDDLWMTVAVPPRLLMEGGRVPVVTPIGRRILWVTRKAGERRLLRAPGLGLPARGRHPQGHLFVRLAPKTGPLDSAARVLLRRFTAAWAA